MANASAFGFSAYDPIGSSGEGFVNEFFGKRSGKNNLKLQIAAMDHQYKLMLRSLRQSPSAQREGLINAGYNPMLAISNGLSHPFSGSSSSSYMSTPNISSATNGFDAAGFALAKEAFKREKVKTDNLKKEGKLLDAETRQKDVQTGSQVLDGVGKAADIITSGKTGGKSKMRGNSSLKSSAKTPQISKGGGTFMKTLKAIAPALMWSAKGAGVAAGAAALAPVIGSESYRKGNSSQGKGTNKWYPHGNWSR